jgi:hypothetical protein
MFTITITGIAILAIVLYLATRRKVTESRPSQDYIHLDSLRLQVLARNDPEYRRGMEPLLRDLSRKFGEHIPIAEVRQYIDTELSAIKTQKAGIVAKVTLADLPDFLGT